MGGERGIFCLHFGIVIDDNRVPRGRRDDSVEVDCYCAALIEAENLNKIIIIVSCAISVCYVWITKDYIHEAILYIRSSAICICRVFNRFEAQY